MMMMMMMMMMIVIMLLVALLVVVVIVLIFEKFCILTAFQCQGHRIIVICYMALKYSESLPLAFSCLFCKS